MEKPIFVTLTGRSNSGKSYLLSHIRDVLGLPCFVSTTTRPPRAGEKEGVDYFFITDKASRDIEDADGFAELVEFNGYRYGVSRTEFTTKLSKGLAFLIVEPRGINKYAEPALSAGAKHVKVFVDCDEKLLIERLKNRLYADIKSAVDAGSMSELESAVNTHVARLQLMLVEEREWKDLADWDVVLSGKEDPDKNVAIIMNTINGEK